MSRNTQVALAVPLRSLLRLSLLAVWQLGCGNSPAPPAGSRSRAANVSVSPSSAAAGSSDLTIIVTAKHPFSFSSTAHKLNQVVWTANGSDTVLSTTFLSSSQLSAVVPASLLANRLEAKVRVEVWDSMGDVPDATSSSVTFGVTTDSTESPSISSISSASAKAGSPDVTITITGSNFDNQFLDTSVAFWTTDPNNLHDSGTMLNTTFVRSDKLTAVIPATLLRNPISVQVVVLTGDTMGMSDGFFGYPKSDAVTFTVTP